jgi:hypothetical protein
VFAGASSTFSTTISPSRSNLMKLKGSSLMDVVFILLPLDAAGSWDHCVLPLEVGHPRDYRLAYP